MKKQLDLDEVNINVLPPKVVMLLSQFAHYIKKHDGIVIKLASKTILKDVHDAHLKVNNYILDDLYKKIVDEVNINIEDKTRPTTNNSSSTLIKKTAQLKNAKASHNSETSS